MARLRTINHAIQDLKPGDWVIQIKQGKFYSPVEVAKITPAQIHVWWETRTGCDKYHSTDGMPIGHNSRRIIRPATPAEIEAYKAEKQRKASEADASRQAQEAHEAARAALSATMPEGCYIQRGNGDTWDIVITERTAEQVKKIVGVLQGSWVLRDIPPMEGH